MGVKGKSGRKRGKYYVENDALVTEVKRYYETGVFSNELGKYINQIAEGVAHMPNFINYFKEDHENPWGVEMMSDAIFRMSKAIVERGVKIYGEDEVGDILYDDDGKVVHKISRKDKQPLIDEEGKKIPQTKENNLFSYFTRITSNAFIARIKIEKKEKLQLEDYKDKVFEDYEHEYGIEHQKNNGDTGYEDFE